MGPAGGSRRVKLPMASSISAVLPEQLPAALSTNSMKRELAVVRWAVVTTTVAITRRTLLSDHARVVGAGHGRSNSVTCA